jgi:hypothetical protein
MNPLEAYETVPSPHAHPKVGLGVLIVGANNRALLRLRRRPPEAGFWSIVGGKLDYLETLEACAFVKLARKSESMLCWTLCLASPTTCCRRKTSIGFRPRISAASYRTKQKTVSQKKPKRSDGLPPKGFLPSHDDSVQCDCGIPAAVVAAASSRADAIIFASLWRN